MLSNRSHRVRSPVFQMQSTILAVKSCGRRRSRRLSLLRGVPRGRFGQGPTFMVMLMITSMLIRHTAAWYCGGMVAHAHSGDSHLWAPCSLGIIEQIRGWVSVKGQWSITIVCDFQSLNPICENGNWGNGAPRLSCARMRKRQ
ncbi:hypothetical protein BJX61DRAFT_191177 [Aspergillus egyptiacus]|nr:hypothetical protein BJX61DRAFT_191177 [Aspergillus egyptiacus]